MSKRLYILCPTVLLLTLNAGCGPKPPAEIKLETPEQKIKSIESSDMPPAVKAKAIEEVRAKQGQPAPAQ
jgi:hypothetical protein